MSNFIGKESLIDRRKVGERGFDHEGLIARSEIFEAQLRVELRSARAEQEIDTSQKRGFADVICTDQHKVIPHLNIDIVEATVVFDLSLVSLSFGRNEPWNISRGSMKCLKDLA